MNDEEQQRRRERLERYARIDAEKAKKRKLAVVISASVLVVIAAGIIWSVVAAAQPGYYDDFAKCLTEKGAVMYGADFCEYTKGQRAMFGNSFKHINYKDFTEGDNIRVTPTWIINGKRYPKAQSFERLAQLTGCEFN